MYQMSLDIWGMQFNNRRNFVIQFADDDCKNTSPKLAKENVCVRKLEINCLASCGTRLINEGEGFGER